MRVYPLILTTPCSTRRRRGTRLAQTHYNHRISSPSTHVQQRPTLNNHSSSTDIHTILTIHQNAEERRSARRPL